MKICFDVNALIYLYTNAPQQLEVLTAYDVAALRGFDACIPACSLADINCILHHCGLRGEKLVWAMGALFEMFHVFDANEQDGLAAFRSDMKDFEDALIAHSAARNGVGEVENSIGVGRLHVLFHERVVYLAAGVDGEPVEGD